MGKVRPKLVKRVARELLETYPGLFTKDFERNKRVVSQLAIIPSKKLRNMIAGYITHLVSLEAKRTTSRAVEEVSETGA